MCNVLHEKNWNLSKSKKLVGYYVFILGYYVGWNVLQKRIAKKRKKKKNQKEFRLENVMKRKGDKLYVKWKGYDSSFNCWIDKKDII